MTCAHALHIKTADGSPVLLRPLLPSDEQALGDAIGRFSNRSRYLRFFTGAQPIPATVVSRLADADGKRHIAWVAIDEAAPGRPVIGAAHAIRCSEDLPAADFAIGLVDEWQNKGVARLLIALLAAEASARGVDEMTADVLWENRRGKALMKALGASSTGSDGDVIHFRFASEGAIERLQETMREGAMEAVFSAIRTGAAVPAAA